METQTKNPFATQNDTSDNIPVDDFTIRTMHDDLLGVNKEGSVKNSQPAVFETPNPFTSENNRHMDNIHEAKSINPFSEKAQEPMIEKKPEPVKEPSKTAPAISMEHPRHHMEPAHRNIEQKKPLSPINNVPIKNHSIHKEGGKASMILFTASMLVVTIALGVGAYYYFMTRTKTTATPVSPVIQPVVEDPVVINPILEKYSVSKPNYLPIDINKSTKSDVAEALGAIASELDSAPNTDPLEFIVVDGNNNPVVFHIFATAIGLKLSPALLNNVDNNFSIYFFKDGSVVRLGLAIDIKNSDKLNLLLIKEERLLPTELSALYIGNKPTILTGQFKDNTYNETPIRYFNVDIQTGLSIDYSLSDKQIIIGTSKDTLRKILDKQKTGTSEAVNTIGDATANQDNSSANTKIVPATPEQPQTPIIEQTPAN